MTCGDKKRRRRNRAIVGVLMFGVVGLLATEADARSWGRFFKDLAISTGLAVVTVGGTAGATVIGTPVAGCGAAVVLGGAEMGGAVAVGASTTGDPPDTVNFAIQANEPLLHATCTPEPTLSPRLLAAAQQVLLDLDALVQTVKNVVATNDRLGGAMLVGTPADIANQDMWLDQFIQTGLGQIGTFQGDLRIYAGYLQNDLLALYDFRPSLADVVAMKNQECAGTFPAPEQSVISDWQLTAFEVGLVQSTFCGIPDALILSGPSLSVGEALLELAAPVPEPAALGLFGAGFASLIALRRRRALRAS